MPHVYFLPDEREVETDATTTILDASLHAGIPHTHVCGGNARCSTCRVVILDGLEFCNPRNAKEQALAERLHFDPSIRLACQTTITGRVKLRRLVLDERDAELTNQLAESSSGAVGEEKRAILLFADIRGFTSFAEPLLPYDVIHVLNRYFHQMNQVIRSKGGVIENYMGDGLFAIFEAAHPGEAALRAVAAGLEMLEAMTMLINPYLESLHMRRLDIGIGIHIGEVVMGTIGASISQRRMVIGDAVNFASRIEEANKQTGTRLLISEDKYEQVKRHISVGQRPRIEIRGKSGEHTLYEVTGMNEGLRSVTHMPPFRPTLQ